MDRLKNFGFPPRLPAWGAAVAALLLPALLVAGSPTAIYVELSNPRPVAVARFEAQRAGAPFDADLHRAAIRAAQDELLSQLTVAGVGYTLTSSSVSLGGVQVNVPHRFSELVNAVRLEVAGDDVRAVRTNPMVRHVSVSGQHFLNLNNSVRYIRANGPDSARSRGIRGQGQIQPDGSATGQVVAVLDTGIDHTNPMFDTTVPDSQFDQRLGDARPVRLAGTPYNTLVHHPKVVYRAAFSGQPVAGDDNGHGTQSASTAAGVKALTSANEVVEGVAPGALVMDYKICPSLLCSDELILLALEEAAKDRDLAGLPKPRATAVNMSFSDCGGDPDSVFAVAAGNLQFQGAVPVASVGNLDLTRELFCDDHVENTIGTPASGRRVMGVGATFDPGGFWGVDVLDPAGVDRPTPGGVTPATGLAVATGERTGINLFPMAGTPAPPGDGVAQYYVFVQDGRTPAQWPANAQGRIGLVRAVSPATFGQVVNSGAAAGALAVLFISNTQNPTAVAATIPGANINLVDGEYLVDLISSTDDDSVDPPHGTLSEFPIRLSPFNPQGFAPDTTGFSARGPNNDFAVVKPDITAPGANILMGTARVNTPTGFTSSSGTSFSAPHITGTAALVRDPLLGRPDFSPSMTRAALMNSSTNLREGDGVTPVADDHDTTFIHEIGAGLAEMVAATSVQALLGTNELNGVGGPDDPAHPDFLPSHSFGLRRWVGTELAATHSRQQASVTVTVADVSGQGGDYALSLADGGRLLGDITRPINTPGLSVSVSPSFVSVPPGGRATFQVSVAADGTAAGVQIAGQDDDGLSGTDILWYVKAERTDGSENLRMPFFLRLAQGVPGGDPVGSTTGGGWIPGANGSKSNFGYSAEDTLPASGHITYDASQQGIKLKGSVASVSVPDGMTASFSGPCTLGSGAACSYEVDVEDNGEPGKGADRFTIRVYDGGGVLIHSHGSLLGGGNIQVRTE